MYDPTKVNYSELINTNCYSKIKRTYPFRNEIEHHFEKDNLTIKLIYDKLKPKQYTLNINQVTNLQDLGQDPPIIDYILPQFKNKKGYKVRRIKNFSDCIERKFNDGDIKNNDDEIKSLNKIIKKYYGNQLEFDIEKDVSMLKNKDF